MESENQKVISEAEELPRTIVRRVVKEKLSHDGDDMSVHKDALLAFSESARIFIHYLSATYLFILFTLSLSISYLGFVCVELLNVNLQCQ